MTSYRPHFEAGLRLFARASEAMRARGFPAPVLVGGGAVELYTLSAISTGDFDIVTASQQEFEQELHRLGFTKPEGIGHSRWAGSIPICCSGSKSSHRPCSTVRPTATASC